MMRDNVMFQPGDLRPLSEFGLNGVLDTIGRGILIFDEDVDVSTVLVFTNLNNEERTTTIGRYRQSFTQIRNVVTIGGLDLTTIDVALG